MTQAFRLSAIAGLAGAVLLIFSPAVSAQGMISRDTLMKQRNDLLTQRATLKDMQAQTSAGNLLLVPNGDSVLPVSADDYRKARQAKLMAGGVDDAKKKAVLERIDREVADLQVRSKTVAQGLLQEVNKEINTLNDVIQASNVVDDNGHRRTDADKIAEDLFSVQDNPTPAPVRSPKSSNPNNLSPEELAESPAAPDAQTRTLTVDNKPAPPPDGTPIVDASASPPPSRSGMDGYDDAVDATHAIAGIVAGIAATAGNRNRGHGGQRSNNNSNGGGHPHPQRPGGC